MKVRLAGHRGLTSSMSTLSKSDCSYFGFPLNWGVKSKPGFVYLSKAYAPFYAMASTQSKKLALVKVAVYEQNAYPRTTS